MSTKYILDTCTVSHLLEGRLNVMKRVSELPRTSTFITPITIAEAYYGILSAPKIKREELEEMKVAIHTFQTLPISATVAYRHAELKKKGGFEGCKNDNDLWLVAYCDDENATLVTTDARLGHLTKFTTNIEIIPLEESGSKSTRKI